MNKYVVWFDFPNLKAYYVDSYIDSLYCSGGNMSVPEFTQDREKAKTFESKEEAMKICRYYAGKYGTGLEVL